MAKAPDSSLSLYEDFSLDAMAADKEEAKKASSGKMLGKLPEGKTVLRMLPPRKGQKLPWRVVYEHFVDIPGAGNVRFVCPRLEAKLPCPVCTKAKQMQASSNSVDQKRGEKLMPQRNLFANVINRRAPEEGVRIFKFGKKIQEQLLEIRDPDEGLGINFTHPVAGRDLWIIRKGTGQFDTEYKVNVDPAGDSPLAADAAAMAELLQQMHNLDALAQVPTSEEIQELLSGRKPARRNDGGAGQSWGGGTAADRVHAGQVVEDE